MDAVNRSLRLRGKRVRIVIVLLLALEVPMQTSCLVQAMDPPESDAPGSNDSFAASGSVTTERSSLGFEPSETIIVRDGALFRAAKHSAPVLQKTPFDLRQVPVHWSLEQPVPERKASFQSPQERLNRPTTIGHRDQLPTSVPLPDFEEMPGPETPAVSKERRAQVRRVIESIRPNADPDTIDVWIEQFASMPDANIEFLVSQSAVLKGEWEPPPIPGFTFESSAHRSAPAMSRSAAELPTHPATTGGTEESHDVVLRNLANVMTVGYREQLELNTVPISTLSGLQRVAVFHHSPGRSVVTGSPLHLAIGTPGTVFFQLEDGRLTRNGMFSRLEDGKIGIRDGDVVVPLMESPVVSSLASFRIETDGTVFEDGRQVGVIPIVEVKQPELLASNNGVYFETEADVRAATDVELQIGVLELSNVDVPRNRSFQDNNRP